MNTDYRGIQIRKISITVLISTLIKCARHFVISISVSYRKVIFPPVRVAIVREGSLDEGHSCNSN